MSKHLLLKLSGSIACYKSAYIASEFVRRGWTVKVVMTESAKHFVGATTFEGLTGQKVYDDLYEGAMDHIELDRWADVVLLCPASANTLNKLATGHADNLLTNLYLAHDFSKPYYIAPAMNSKMLHHSATQESLHKVQSHGANILFPESGSLACGENGEGRLLEPSKILNTIFAQQENEKRVLVTFGGTRETIDGARYLTNTSTGRTGESICRQLFAKGYRVTAVHSNPLERVGFERSRTFISADDLETVLQDELQTFDYDIVIQCAAVSDFRVKNSGAGQKFSSDKEMNILLAPREKTISKIKGWSKSQNVKVLGFKMTVGADAEEQRVAAVHLLEQGNVDAVIANDASQISSSGHKFKLIAKSGVEISGTNKSELAAAVIEWIEAGEV